MVVFDEGHILKNDETKLSLAVSQIRTKRRIILTGTPLQNNLNEYYCMVNIVKPNLLGNKKEFANRFLNPIENGQYYDSTLEDIQLMKRRSYILHSLLDGFVQRKDVSVLLPYLPSKQEFTIYTRLHQMQSDLYKVHITWVKTKIKLGDPFFIFYSIIFKTLLASRRKYLIISKTFNECAHIHWRLSSEAMWRTKR